MGRPANGAGLPGSACVDGPYGKRQAQIGFDRGHVQENGGWKSSYVMMKRPRPAFGKT